MPATTESDLEQANALEAQTESSTILIVEDYIPQQEALREYLTRPEYLVNTAGTAREALTFLHKGTTASAVIVLMDIILPDGNGITLCRQMKEEIWRFLYVVFLSSHNTAEIRAQAYEAGAQAYLTKPVNPAELRGCILAARNNINEYLRTLRDITGVVNPPVFEAMVR